MSLMLASPGRALLRWISHFHFDAARTNKRTMTHAVAFKRPVNPTRGDRSMSNEATVHKESHEQKVTPWDVEGEVVDGVSKGIDYEKLMKQFGCQPLTTEMIERMERLTGKKAHVLIRRGMFYCHRYTFWCSAISNVLATLTGSWICTSRASPSTCTPGAVLVRRACTSAT